MADTGRSPAAGISFEGVSMTFAGVRAFEPVSLDVKPGAFVSIVGTSGCGKTTLLRIAAGLIAPSEGTVNLGGARPGMCFQYPRLLPWRNSLDNVTLPLELAGISPDERQDRGIEMLRMVGMVDAWNRMPVQLSGGMRMRVGLARALVERHQDDRSARSLLQMVRIERAVAAEEISSADGLLKDARAQGFDIEPTTELGVAELWLSEGEPQRSLEIAERVLKELDAPPASSAADGKDAGPADAEEDAEYRRYVRGVALLVRGLCRAELGDPASAVKDLTAAVQLAPDEETAADWGNYLDQVREKSR